MCNVISYFRAIARRIRDRMLATMEDRQQIPFFRDTLFRQKEEPTLSCAFNQGT